MHCVYIIVFRGRRFLCFAVAVKLDPDGKESVKDALVNGRKEDRLV